MTMYPNSRVAPHQERAGAHVPGQARIEAAALGDSFEPNRQQRRDYVRHNQPRNARLHLIGMGAWRKPRQTDEPSWAKQTALFAPLESRRERRPDAIREAKLARWVRRRNYQPRTLRSLLTRKEQS